MKLHSKRSVLISALAVVSLLALCTPAHANLAAGAVTKTTAAGTVTAGGVVTYTINVSVTVGVSTNVTVTDPLPTDFPGGNLQVDYVSSTCSSSSATPIPPCLGGQGALGANGVVTWVFPGDTAAGTTLTATLTVRLKPSLNNGVVVSNTATAQDDQATGPRSGTAPVTVSSALLGISKGPNPPIATTVAGGQIIPYEIDLTNPVGALPAKGVIIQDVLPAGESYVTGSAMPNGFPDDCVVCGVCSDGAGGPCPASGGVLTWQYDTLFPGAGILKKLTYQVQVNTNLQPGASLFNVATIFDSAGHIAVATDTRFAQSPCLSVTKSVTSCTHPAACNGSPLCVTADQPGPLDTVAYSITVSNAVGPGCQATSGLSVVDTVPQNMTFVSCTGGTGCFFDGTKVTWGNASLAPGGSTTLTLSLQVNQGTPNGTSIQNIATASAQNAAKAQGLATVTVRPPILNLVKIGSPNPVEPGGTLNYAFSLSNSGLNCSHGIDLLDTLPSNAVLQLGSIASSCVGGGSALFLASDRSKFDIGEFDLAAGASCTGTYKVLVPQSTAPGQNVVNTIKATDNQLNTAQTSATTPVQTRLINLTKTATGCTFPPGGPLCNLSNVPPGAEVTYTLAVSVGPFASSGTQVTDSLPPPSKATFKSTDCPSFSLAGTVLTCSLGDIAAGTTQTFHVTILVNSTNTPGTMIVNSATATNDAMDVLNISNTVQDEADLQVGTPPAAPAPQLSVNVSANKDQVGVGGALTYTVQVQNTGDATAHNVVLNDTLPGGVRLKNIPSGCSGSRSAGSLTCNLGNLDPGQSTSVTVHARVPRLRKGGAKPGDILRHTVTASSAEGNSASGSTLTTVATRIRKR